MAVQFISFVLIALEITSSLYCNPTSHRNLLNVYRWDDIMYCNNIALNKPFLIENSPLKDWSKSTKQNILHSIMRVSTSINYQSSNCDCFNDTNLCKNYVESFLYSRSENHFPSRMESIWYQYESMYLYNKKYVNCINKQMIPTTFEGIIKRMNDLESDDNYNGNITSLRFNFQINIGNKDKSNYENVIDMKPYFNIFDFKNKYNDIDKINIWMGSTHYISTLHFDSTDNIYFMLDGTKRFLLSSPDLDNKFTLFPVLNKHWRHTMHPLTQKERNNIQYEVDLKENEILWIPSYWYHQVINGNYNSFAINVWTINYQENNLKSFKFSKKIGEKLQNINYHWNEMLYFINNLIHRYFDNSDKFNFLFKYFSKIYPILTSIQHYHSIIGNKHKINHNLEWVPWFIDLDAMLKCAPFNRWDILTKILKSRINSLICLNVDEKDANIWNKQIDDLLPFLNDLKQIKGYQAAQIELAGIIENMIYILSNHVMFHPLIIALHFV